MLSIFEALNNNSIVSVLKGRALNRTKLPDLTSEDKIEKQAEISGRLTPSPDKDTDVDKKQLGFKKIEILKHPHFLV